MSTITKTFLDDCCNISGTQNCPVINDLCLEQVSLVQDLLWADYLGNLECALLRPYGDSMVEEPTPKRTRRDSPVSPMHILILYHFLFFLGKVNQKNHIHLKKKY